MGCDHRVYRRCKAFHRSRLAAFSNLGRSANKPRTRARQSVAGGRHCWASPRQLRATNTTPDRLLARLWESVCRGLDARVQVALCTLLTWAE